MGILWAHTGTIGCIGLKKQRVLPGKLTRCTLCDETVREGAELLLGGVTASPAHVGAAALRYGDTRPLSLTPLTLTDT